MTPPPLTATCLAFTLALACASGPAHAASRACERVTLALAPGVTPAIVARDWGSGEAHVEPPATLVLHDCAGHAVDRLELDAPLAKLDPQQLAGAPRPTWLVSVDLTAPAGSTSGPSTVPVQVVDHRLRVVEARSPGGERAPIRLALTGKAAWRRVRVSGADDLVAVRSERVDGAFVTKYLRYHRGPHGWESRRREESGLWESDGPFPPMRAFP